MRKRNKKVGVLVLAGIELIFLSVAAVLIALMFSVVAMKSRTFSSLPYLANEQACRSWEGAQPDRAPSWSMEIFHTKDVMLIL